jgi:hypothetical protein
MRRGCFVVLACVLSTLCFCPRANGSPLKDPRRSIAGHVIVLTPLFTWWAKHEGPRPLSAWVHLTGSIVGTNTAGWILEAKVEKTEHVSLAATESESPGSPRIILRNPPLQDRAEFDALRAQLTELNQQHAMVAGEEAQAKNRADAIAREERANRRNGFRARALGIEARQVSSAEKQAKSELQPLDQQIQALKKKLAAYSNAERYDVDCFALDTGQEYRRMPIYDHGQLYR